MNFRPVMDRLSIRVRLAWGGALVLVVFLAGAGWSVQQAHADSVLASRYANLRTVVYLLMAGAELDANNALVMPADLAEPRLSLPASGLYAHITNTETAGEWRSASALGLAPPFERTGAAGQWRYATLPDPVRASGKRYLSASYGVNWSVNARTATLVFSVLEDARQFDSELAAFQRTLWSWLAATGILLLLAQSLLLRWGLAPLRRMTLEIRAVESGQQARMTGRYPAEIAGVTENLNVLIDQERARQTRYKHALDDLAHSLKTPLAVMRSMLADGGNSDTPLSQQIATEVTRIDDIVVHQLGRAGASGAARFAPPLALAPVLARIRASLVKVYADKNLTFTVQCPPGLVWRIDEGDAFEMLGNLLDNAAKWAKSAVVVHVMQEAERLHIRITDDGPGFSDPQALKGRRIRLDENVPGHGIGLSVVRDLVSSHDGELTLSRADEGGARVDIELRKA